MGEQGQGGLGPTICYQLLIIGYELKTLWLRINILILRMRQLRPWDIKNLAKSTQLKSRIQNLSIWKQSFNLPRRPEPFQSTFAITVLL